MITKSRVKKYLKSEFDNRDRKITSYFSYSNNNNDNNLNICKSETLYNCKHEPKLDVKPIISKTEKNECPDLKKVDSNSMKQSEKQSIFAARSHIYKKIRKCENCSKMLTEYGYLKHSCKELICKECNLVFYKKSKLSCHLMKHARIEERDSLEFDSSFFSTQIDVDELAESKDIESITSKDFNKFEDALDITDFEKERIINNEFPRINLEPINITDLDLDESETENEPSIPLSDVQNSLDNFNTPPVKENEEIVKEAKKKRQNVVKECKTKVQVFIANKGQEKKITLSRLMALGRKIEYQECTNDLGCPSFLSGISSKEMESLIEEMDELSDDEINEIIEIYNRRDYKAYENVKIKEYKLKKDIENTSVAAEYVCHYCDQFTTTSFSKYYIHLRNHNSEIVRRRPHLSREKCVVCGVIVPSEALSHHIRLHKDHICCYICKTFVHEDEYASHLMSHKDHYRCNICGDIYKTLKAIVQHMLHHRKGQTYLCEHCNSIFCSLNTLIVHISLDHEMIDAKYTECIYCFELTVDIANHTFTRDTCKFKCKACSKIESNEKDFKSHFQMHASGMKIKSVTKHKSSLTCSVCGFVTTSMKNARDHVLCHKIDTLYTEHVVRKPRIQCEICKTIMLKSYIEQHMDKHNYYDRCSTCAKFVLKNNIQDHISAHELEFKCVKCDERLSTEKDLSVHKDSHGRMMPRPCHLCHLTFFNERNRVKHISAVHNNIDSELIECIYCKEIFFDTFENYPNDNLNPIEDIEYHLWNPIYCQRRCKLCNERHKTAKLYRSHMFNDHGLFLCDSDSGF